MDDVFAPGGGHRCPDTDTFASVGEGVFDRAVAAGATIKRPVQDEFWGDRYGTVEDPFGHRWSIATHVRDVSPEEMQAAMAKAYE